MPEVKRLVRDVHNKMVAGVCSGLAKYLNIDPTVIRVIYVFLTLFSLFVGVLFYLILWLIIPEEEQPLFP
ncbi:MAG: PspC domain-containing protein [Bacteroidales bacterium]|nr:PspC domain-containing protein [Bacteroidales bacterium]